MFDIILKEHCPPGGNERERKRSFAVYEDGTPKLFWSAMLPICWILAPVLGMMAQSQAMNGRSIEDRTLQSLLFTAMFMAVLGLMAVRVVIGQAIAEHHKGQAIVVAALSLVSSVVLIAYGVSTLT